MRVIDGITAFGDVDANTLVQAKDIASRAERVALMADNHLGYVMPIGGVAAYRNKVSVVGVGFDIACGNCCIRTNLNIEDLTGFTALEALANPYRVQQNPVLNEIADTVAATISFGIGRKNNADDAPVEHPLFIDDSWYCIPNAGGYRDTLRDKARQQLGTVGSGNHYVDIFFDTLGTIWVGVHFGSRGLGHTIASNFLALSQGGSWGDRGVEQETLLDLDTELGDSYWRLMTLAGEYAYAGREWVARKVVSILGAEEVDLVHNHHNFAWKEWHEDLNGEPQEYVVVRKGATPAFPGQRGFVGGSMGDISVILQGSGTYMPGHTEAEHEARALQIAAMCSTVHGAGRVMSRTEAAGKWKKGKQVRPGKVSRTEVDEWLARKGVILRGGGLDESPQVYRRLPDVLAAQGPTIDILHTLHPVVVVMAGANEVDPYKE